VGDGGCAPFFVQGDVATFGAEGGFDRVGQGVDAPFERATRIVIKCKLFSHKSISLFRKINTGFIGTQANRVPKTAVMILEIIQICKFKGEFWHSDGLSAKNEGGTRMMPADSTGTITASLAK